MYVAFTCLPPCNLCLPIPLPARLPCNLALPLPFAFTPCCLPAPCPFTCRCLAPPHLPCPLCHTPALPPPPTTLCVAHLPCWQPPSCPMPALCLLCALPCHPHLTTRPYPLQPSHLPSIPALPFTPLPTPTHLAMCLPLQLPVPGLQLPCRRLPPPPFAYALPAAPALPCCPAPPFAALLPYPLLTLEVGWVWTGSDGWLVGWLAAAIIVIIILIYQSNNPPLDSFFHPNGIQQQQQQQQKQYVIISLLCSILAGRLTFIAHTCNCIFDRK